MLGSPSAGICQTYKRVSPTATVPPVRGVLIALTLLGFSASAALAAGPLQAPPAVRVYTDFATHGRLTHEYSPALLRRILDDASLNQYGDPIVMMRLRHAIRRQLDRATVESAEAPLFGIPQWGVVAGMLVLSGGFAFMRARAKAAHR